MVVEHVREDLERMGYACLRAREFPWPAHLSDSRERLLESWSSLERDAFMGDGGTYRYRRFGLFRLDREDLSLEPREGSSIYQSLSDNPLNGGVVRTFEPLAPATASSPGLHHVIRFDWSQLPIEPEAPRYWQVGVHQVRILARPGEPGKPTPEGPHYDGEAYTVQHLIARENVEGGCFQAYDEYRQPLFRWLQTETFDSLFFTKRLLHDASPVACQDPGRPGRREILLIDFDPLP